MKKISFWSHRDYFSEERQSAGEGAVIGDSHLINSIPGAVIGGISFLLYGMIGTSGLRILVDQRVDYGKSRNLAMTSVIFVTGLSGIAINVGTTIQIKGMALAALVGMLMGLVFYILDKLKLTNDREDSDPEPKSDL